MAVSREFEESIVGRLKVAGAVRSRPIVSLVLTHAMRVVVVLFSGVTTGCQSVATAPDASNYQRVVIGHSQNQRTLTCDRFGVGSGGALIIAGVHGNEHAAIRLAETLLAHLHVTPPTVPLDLVCVANPDGQAANRRENAAGVDLNRDFPATNQLTEECVQQPESAALRKWIMAVQPALIVSIHEPLACVDYDGPAKASAIELSRIINLPVRKLGARPGSLGSWAGEDLGIPVVTLELPARTRHWKASRFWNRFGQPLLQYLQSRDPHAKLNEANRACGAIGERRN